MISPNFGPIYSLTNLLFGALPRTTAVCDSIDSAKTSSLGFIFFNSLTRFELVEYCSVSTSLPVLSLSPKTMSKEVVKASSVFSTNLDSKFLGQGH